jgi:hypothetical protein
VLPGWIILVAAGPLLTTSPYAPGLPCDAFVRDQNGCWSPTRPVEITTSEAGTIAITPGVKFCRGGLLNGLALAEQLERQCVNPTH